MNTGIPRQRLRLHRRILSIGQGFQTVHPPFLTVKPHPVPILQLLPHAVPNRIPSGFVDPDRQGGQRDMEEEQGVNEERVSDIPDPRMEWFDVMRLWFTDENETVL